MTVRRRAQRLWQAAAFLGTRLLVGAGAYLLLAAGLVVAGAVAVAGAYALLLVVVAAGVAALAAVVFPPVRRRLRPLLGRRGALPRLPTSRVAPAVVWWLLALRATARRERAAVAAYRGAAVDVSYRPLPEEDSARLRTLVADPATWRDLGCLVVVPLVCLVVCLGLVILLASSVVALAVPPMPSPQLDPWAALDAWTAATWAAVVLAGAGLVVSPLLVRPAADGVARLAAALLATGERARMRAELDEQRLRRQLAVEAAEVERRRIERDLHDGAQQRLVSLGLHLGMARQALTTDPATGAALVEEAHEEAKQALAELRDLARGIHPAILGDRGLDAALSALAGRSAVPVDIDVSLPARPPTAVESAAYFVVAESLTNVTRHAAARSATVRIASSDGTLVVEVGDDGVGGAHLGAGTGLAGLADRVGGLGGRLTVDSPAGGPTTVTAEIPCAS